MAYLSLGDLLAMAEQMYGTSRMVRDPGLLHAAAYRTRASLFGEDLYPTVHLKAAALMESLVHNHALIDGNKRLAFAATAVFYDLNGWRLLLPNEDAAVDLVVKVANGALDLHRIAVTLERWAQTTPAGP